SCPLPWAWLAILLWRFTRAKESYMRHAAQHERRVVAENWSGTSNMRGPITVKVSSMSGELREIRGFSEYSVILQLRRAVAEVFDTDFDFVGLLFGAELLRPDVDFQTFGQLGMVDGCAVSFVRSDPEGLPRAEKLAGACETNAFAFFRRNRNVYKALDCQHLGQLRLARATVGNFGANYTKGWNCDGCEKHFANGTMLHRCDVPTFSYCMDFQAEAVSNGARFGKHRKEAHVPTDPDHWPALVQQAALAASSAAAAEASGISLDTRGYSKTSMGSMRSVEEHLSPFAIALSRRRAREAKAREEHEEREAPTKVKEEATRPETPAYPSPFKEQPPPPPMPPDWSERLWEDKKRELAEERSRRAPKPQPQAERQPDFVQPEPPPAPPREDSLPAWRPWRCPIFPWTKNPE
ncbi:unnamed protein product, partial [Effrenium voratum]